MPDSGPIFEPTDLLSFDFGGDQTSTPFANDEQPATAPEASTSNARAAFSPPPEIDEEPSDFEDDAAMYAAEAARAADVKRLANSEAAARRRAAIFAATQEQTQSESPPLSQLQTGVTQTEKRGEGSQPFFVPDFDLGLDIGPVASSSRREASPAPVPDAVDALGCPLPQLRATTASGDYVQFRRRQRPRAPVDKAHEKATETFDLLTTPLHHLMKEVDELKSLDKARELEQQLNADMREIRPKGKAPATTMWVDKYRPKQFTDLLGEDRVHREVMSWLKEWDKCVFKRVPPKKRKMEDTNGVPFDALGRPRDRILLLSGPPGYGKTTLAHVVARHAGYRTLEINASDDRSAATVTTRIKNAIDAGSGLGAEGRPTCVIIDEIDGASGGGDTSFVRSLIKLIQDVPARKKSNTPAKPLRRPIICICNDLYATALRPLRPAARIVRFRKPPSQFLVARLREICDREKLRADLRVLTSLVDLTGSDVRSCLNTLQFIKSKSSIVTADAIKSSSVGAKDSGTSLQTAWNSLFAPMAAKQRRKMVGIDDGRYVDRLALLVQTCGEHERLVQGLFEHYPNLKPLDASLQNLGRLHDWVAYYDRLSGRIASAQEFELLAYIPYAIVPWYSHMAAPANAGRPAEWPRADYESYQTRVANEEIATSLKSQVPPVIRSLFSSTTTLTELIPLLVRIISPPLKPVNANIVKPGERAVLSRLVELMIPFGLQFWQEKLEDGQPMMRLEPAIDVFVHYEGKRAGDIGASRFAVRQLIAQAIDAELARRRGQAGADAAPGTSTAQHLAKQYDAAKTGIAEAKDAPAEVPTDFFGRVRPPKPATTNLDSGPNPEQCPADVAAAPRKRFRAVYKFNEGSSSAVRKNAKMAALM